MTLSHLQGKLSVAPTAAAVKAELPWPMCLVWSGPSNLSDGNALLPYLQAFCVSFSHNSKDTSSGLPSLTKRARLMHDPITLLPIPLMGSNHSLDHHPHHVAHVLIFLYDLCPLPAGELRFASTLVSTTQLAHG